MTAIETAYDLSSDCASTVSCYMTGGTWAKSGSTMATWKPGGQSYADFIDFDYGGSTYLVGVGTYDGSVLMFKLDGDGGGDIVGHAYSRVTVDYTASSSSLRTMNGFGAGCASRHTAPTRHVAANLMPHTPARREPDPRLRTLLRAPPAAACIRGTSPTASWGLAS